MANKGRILVYFDEIVMALTKAYAATMDTHIYSPRDILSSVQGLHPVDAVEVVRCKDCKHYFHYGDGVYGCRTFGMMKTKPDGFCSYGERR